MDEFTRGATTPRGNGLTVPGWSDVTHSAASGLGPISVVVTFVEVEVEVGTIAVGIDESRTKIAVSSNGKYDSVVGVPAASTDRRLGGEFLHPDSVSDKASDFGPRALSAAKADVFPSQLGTVLCVAERVVAIDLGITWDPNAPDAVLVSNDNGSTVLAMRASDASQRESCLLLIWSGARFAAMTPPNDEAIFGHRLYSTGLADVLWAGVVHDSQLVSELEQRNRVHASHDPTRFQELTHHVIRTKECVIEVVAEALDVSQASGPTALAAANAITS